MGQVSAVERGPSRPRQGHRAHLIESQRLTEPRPPVGSRGAASLDRMDCAGETKFVKVGTWLLTSIIVSWIVAVVVLAATAFAAKFSVARPTGDNQRNHAAHYEIALAVVLVAVPALAAALGYVTRHGHAAVVLLVVSAVLVVPAVYVGRVGVHDGRGGHTTPAPIVTQCIPRSGSMNRCPGG